jgi:hypothetical protein
VRDGTLRGYLIAEAKKKKAEIAMYKKDKRFATLANRVEVD